MKILASVDFSDITEKVLEQCKILSKAMTAEVFLVHVAEENSEYIIYDYGYNYDSSVMISSLEPSEIRDQLAQRFHNEHKNLQEYADELRKEGVKCTALMVQGPCVKMLLNEVDKLSVDFIIVGSHGKGAISQILLGSTSKDLIKESPIPIYLVSADK
ncbi:MAG: universal stress protein [Proteobacteria bacterium]|nr:universal stress protein [Pseudomonadota bacterium]